MSRSRPIVLCVTSNDSGLSRQQAALESDGYIMVTVFDARDALAALADCQVDAILLDSEAAGTNSGPLVRRMKHIKPHIPVLLLISASARIDRGGFPMADAIVRNTESPARLLKILDHLLNVRFPFFTRWFGNWKHRVSA